MVSTNSLQNAESASFLVGLTQAATIGGAMQLAYAGAGFKYDGPVTPGADALAAMAQANGAILEAERMKGMLDVSLHGEIDLIISQIRAARASGDVGAIREATQRLREGLDTARAIQTTNNNEMTDVQQRMDAMWARYDELTHNINEVLKEHETPEERARREAAEERVRIARERQEQAYASGNPAAIAAANADVQSASTNLTNVTGQNIDAQVTRGDITPQTGANLTTWNDQRLETIGDGAGQVSATARGTDVSNAPVAAVNYGPARTESVGNSPDNARRDTANPQPQYAASSLFDISAPTETSTATVPTAQPTNAIVVASAQFQVAEYDGSALGRPSQPAGPNGGTAISL